MPVPFETAFGLLRNAGICRAPEELALSEVEGRSVSKLVLSLSKGTRQMRPLFWDKDSGGPATSCPYDEVKIIA